MADIVTSYTLTTPGPDITFNAGTLGDGTDKYWLDTVAGLDGPNLRLPSDLVPFGDGSIIHTSRKAGCTPRFEGTLLIESSNNLGDCQQLRNVLADNLRSALNSILAPTSGTLSWTPIGLGARTLTVFAGSPSLEITYTDNFLVSRFAFGLMSEAAEWS